MKTKLSLLFVFLLACAGGGKGKGDAVNLAASEDWMGIYIQNAKIGYVYSRQEIKGSNYYFTQKSTMKLEMLGSNEQFATNLEATTDSTLNMLDFTFDISSRQHSFYATGKREDDKIIVTVKTSGRTETKEVNAKGQVIISPALGTWVLSQSPEPGDKFSVNVFEPTLLRSLPVTVKTIGPETIDINGKQVEAMKFETKMLGMGSEVWLDETGTSIKEIQKPQIMMVRESRAKALEAVSETAQLDLLSFFAVTPDSAITNPRNIRELRLKISGIDKETDLTLASATQIKKGIGEDKFELKITAPDTASVNRTVIPMTEPQQYLGSSVFIQTTDSRIQQTAAKIVDGETDAMNAAKKLVDWVYKTLDKRATASVPSAVEVMDTKEGDCNEHAILIAALGRAVGIPTKINVGLIYLDGAFYYHAWNSFWIGETWIPADATFGQLPADPTHIQLHEGELDEQAKVLSIVGEIEIDVISYK